MKKQSIKRFFSTPTAGMLCGARRHAMMLLTTLLLTMTAQTAWAADNVWPSYITDVVLVGGTEKEAQDAKSDYSGYTWCSQKMNEGSGADIIYIGYKTSTSANTNGGYITDFIIIDAGTGDAGHNPPSDLTFQGRKYYLCPAAGGNYFVNSNHGNLTSQAEKGWNMYLYYTRASFDDKRAVSSITITEGKDTQSGALNLYYKDGTLHEKEISLNRGVSGTPYVYMHISTATKVNRPNPEPTTNSGLTYNGSPQKLISSNYTNHNSGTVYYRVGNTGSYTTDVNSITATNAGQYIVWYYSGADSYGNSSVEYRHYKYVKIKKSPNNGATVTCSNHFEETATVPELKGTNLSSGAITYQYSTSQKGTYTTTVPTAPGTYWVKATIAGDDNCDEFTTAATSFNIIYDWRTHNSGAEDDAYVLSTVADLKYLAVWVNSGSNNYAGKYFKLGDDIAFDKSTADNFNPIGNSTHPFAGHFDGNGKTISGLNINKPNNDAVGLFGYVKNGTTIKNLKLDNSTIIGNDNVGAILGRGNDGKQTTVENCFVTSSVNVSGTSNVGGIVGGFANVRGCVSVATVSGVNSVGGIIGTGNLITIANCLYTGTSVSDGVNIGGSAGAITGYKGSGTYDCNYYTQTIIDVNDEDATIGGTDEGDTNGARKAVAINKASGVTFTPTGTATTYNVSGITAYADNNVIGYGGNFYAGATESVNLDITCDIDGFGITGYTDGVGSPATALAYVSGNTYTLTMTANAPTVTPVGSDLWGVTTAGRNGSADHPYLITTPEGLNLLAKKVNGDGYTANTYSGKYFELGEDITYNGSENNYTAIGTYNNISDNHPFSGIFDGKGHTVSGINIKKSADDNQGIFGYIRNAEVKNLTLTNSTITANNTAGGIVGYSYPGTIENCHVTSTVTIQGVQSDLTTLGGIVGSSKNSSTIEPTISGCTSAATVTGARFVGGIVGSNFNGTVKNCLVLGASVSGTSYVGSIVGYMNSGTITNNRYIGTNVGGEGIYGSVYGSDVAGQATVAYEFPISIGEANIAMGTEVTTYGTGSYQGITAYGNNGLYYKGNLYYPSLWSGAGTADNPYVIYNTAGLDKLANDVNNGNKYKKTHFALGTDIAYDKTALTIDFNDDGTNDGNFRGIGDFTHEYYGNFDGRGHTISGLVINKPSDSFNIGLFGVNTGEYVRNLTVANSDIIGTGQTNVGAIVGGTTYKGLTIENCHVTSDVTVTGYQFVGGIIGNNGNVKGCTSAATVSGWGAVGGIIGNINSNDYIVSNNLYLGNSVTLTDTFFDFGAIIGGNDGSSSNIANNYHTAYGLGGAYGSDTNGNGAQFAVSSTTKPDGFGDATATYGTGSYTGITAYANGLYYNGRYYWHEELTTIEIADHSTTNSNIIINNHGQKRNVKLKDRTLYKDGKWNTIFLPFDVDMTDHASPLYGAEAHALTAASISGSTLNLTFGNAVTELVAGTPYIIKWASGDNIENPIFTNVTIQNVGGDFQNGYDIDHSTVVFRGIYDAWTGNRDLSAFYADASNNGYDKPFDVLLLGGNNTLRYAGSGASLGACRAYFLIDPAAVTGSNAHQLTDFNIDFGDGEGETTGIVSIDHSPLTIDHSAGAWYSIDGRKLQGKPTQKGLYIVNGRKVVIK